MLPAAPTSWSLESVDNVIHCSITWSTDPVSTTGSAAPASPIPSRLDDSGYASPEHSPIPFVLPSEDVIGPLTSPATPKTTMDATTETTSLPTCSSSSQTPPATTLMETSVQPSLPTQRTTLDAATTTTSCITTSCSSQTPTTTSTNSCLQTALPQPPIASTSEMPHQFPNPLISTTTQTTTSPKTDESGVQASTSPIITTHNAETQSPNPLLGKINDKATSCTQTTQSNLSCYTTDASTHYDPHQIDLWCRFCHSQISNNETPLLHLVSSCGATPEDLLLPLEKLNKELGQKLKIPRRTVRAASTLLLSCHDPNAMIPRDLITEFAMKLIPDYDEYHTFMKATDDLTTSIIHQLQTHLSLDPSTTDLSDIFTTIEPTESIPSDDDDDPVYDDEPDWADLAEHYLYFGHDDVYDDCF